MHDDVTKWKHFLRYWTFVRGIHRSPVNSPHKGQWRGALMFSLIRAWINDWVNNRKAGDLRHNRAHYDVSVMVVKYVPEWWQWRHNERDGVSNHQPRDCLLNRLFKAQIQKNIKAPRHWPLWGEFPAQKASNAENVSIWWRHNEYQGIRYWVKH